MKSYVSREDRAHLEKVITDFQDQLFRFAFFRLGTFSEAEDVVQDVFIRMITEHSDLSEIASPKGYLYRAVSNACNDCLRRRRNIRFVPAEVAAVEAEEEEAGFVEEYARIEKLLGELPPEQAEVIRMKTVGSLTFAEIAGRTGKLNIRWTKTVRKSSLP